VAQALTWVSTLLVVRILTPDDYGIVALAALYLGLVTMLSEFGLGTAVVTMRDLPLRQIAQLNSVSLLVALTALAVAWVLAIPMADLVDSPRLVTLIRVMSVGLIVAALGSVPAALLQKSLRFRFLAAAQIAQSITAAVASLLLALFGAGYWALALGPLLGQVVLSVMVVGGAPCGYFWPDWQQLRPALRFSRTVILERFCWFLYTGSDRFVIGKLIGEAAVGLYSVASSFGMMAVEKVAVLVLRVAPAAFAEVQGDPPALRRYLLSMTEGLSIVTFPIAIGIALVAGDTVHLLFGEQWSGAIAPLRILAVFSAYHSVGVLMSRVLAAIGDVRYLMRVGMLTLATLPVAFMIGTRWGLAGVAAIWILIYPVTQWPLFYRLNQRIQLRAGEYLRALWPAASGALLMGLAVFALRQWEPVASLPRTARLTLRVCVGATIYTLAILIFHSERVRRFKALMGELRMKNESSPEPAESGAPGIDRPRLVS
jgi:O-antigen/teichoic acid export membrane protein